MRQRNEVGGRALGVTLFLATGALAACSAQSDQDFIDELPVTAPDHDVPTAALNDTTPVQRLAFGSEIAEGNGVTLEPAPLEELEAQVAEMERQGVRSSSQLEEMSQTPFGSITQFSCLAALGAGAEILLGETAMGSWNIQSPFCNVVAWCPDNTFAYSFSVRSLGQISGDNLAVTAFALACHNPLTGAFVEWAVSTWTAGAGSWDESNSPCTLSQPLKGGRVKLEDDQPGSFDATGLTDAQMFCGNGTAVDVTPNNPGWGTWRSTKNCPSDERVCGFNPKADPPVSGSDDAGITGIELYCCDF